MLSVKTMNKLVLNSNAYQIKRPMQKDEYTELFEKELEKSPSLTAISDGLEKIKTTLIIACALSGGEQDGTD